MKTKIKTKKMTVTTDISLDVNCIEQEIENSVLLEFKEKLGTLRATVEKKVQHEKTVNLILLVATLLVCIWGWVGSHSLVCVLAFILLLCLLVYSAQIYDWGQNIFSLQEIRPEYEEIQKAMLTKVKPLVSQQRKIHFNSAIQKSVNLEFSDVWRYSTPDVHESTVNYWSLLLSQKGPKFVYNWTSFIYYKEEESPNFIYIDRIYVNTEGFVQIEIIFNGLSSNALKVVKTERVLKILIKNIDSRKVIFDTDKSLQYSGSL